MVFQGAMREMEKVYDRIDRTGGKLKLNYEDKSGPSLPTISCWPRSNLFLFAFPGGRVVVLPASYAGLPDF